MRILLVNSATPTMWGGGEKWFTEAAGWFAERGHEVAHAEPRALQVDQWIQHELPGTVIRDLAATVDLHDRYVAGREHVRAIRVESEREDRPVFE